MATIIKQSETEEKVEIKVDDQKIIVIDGFIREDQCTNCGNPLVFYEKHDAEFCPQCNVWASEPCADTACDFCTKRPEKPL